MTDDIPDGGFVDDDDDELIIKQVYVGGHQLDHYYALTVALLISTE